MTTFPGRATVSRLPVLACMVAALVTPASTAVAVDEPGEFSFPSGINGRTSDLTVVPAGIYFVELRTADRARTVKVTRLGIR